LGRRSHHQLTGDGRRGDPGRLQAGTFRNGVARQNAVAKPLLDQLQNRLNRVDLLGNRQGHLASGADLLDQVTDRMWARRENQRIAMQVAQPDCAGRERAAAGADQVQILRIHRLAVQLRGRGRIVEQSKVHAPEQYPVGDGRRRAIDDADGGARVCLPEPDHQARGQLAGDSRR
jgi:hypothetical protein